MLTIFNIVQVHRPIIFSLKIVTILFFLIVGGIIACAKTDKNALIEIKNEVFTDVTEIANLSRMRNSYSHCLGDINGDGLLDIYIINHHQQKPTLYKNNGDGTFIDVTHNSKVGRWGDLHGCAIGDYDNDGDQDIYVTIGAQRGTGVGSNRLYQNNGEGEFINVASETGIADPKGRGRTASWVDYNNDGYLDLFVANYTRKDAPSVLFENNGNGTFSNVSVESGLNLIDSIDETSWIDYDNDGRMDLITLSHRKHRKYEINIYKNYQNGTFKKIKTFYGWTYAFGDYDNDGDLDVFISVPPRAYIYQFKYTFTPLTKIFRGFNKLYENTGEGQFIDVSEKAGFRNKMGGNKAVFFDYDNDGDLDIYLVVGGTNNKNLNDMIFDNNGNKTFTDITKDIGFIQNLRGRGSGVAYGDFNNDGFLDLFLTNGRNPEGYIVVPEGAAGPYVLYENRPNSNHWIKIKLIGTQSNRDGIGARLKLYYGNQILYRQNVGGMEGYVQHSKIIHFGLGKATNVDKIEIIWPSGHVTNITDIASDQTLVVREY